MPFSFAALFGMLPTAISTVEALLNDPNVQALEALIASNFTHTATPGSAAILEPKTTAPMSTSAPDHGPASGS